MDIEADRSLLLELHCQANFESETPWARKVPYEEYREKWLSTSQPDSFISHLKETVKDQRTIAEILEEEGNPVAYIWVIFSDIQGYDVTVGEVMDVVVTPSYRHRGIGMKLMKHMERLSHARGASLLRSGTGIENKASQRLHEKPALGFVSSVLRSPFSQGNSERQ